MRGVVSLGSVLVWVLSAVSLAGCTIETTQGNPATLQPLSTSTGNLGLAGTIIYNTSTVKDAELLNTVEALNLEDGTERTIFEGPPNAWLDAAMVSPDFRQIILAYAPPPAALNHWQQALYIIPFDGSSAPELLFPPASPADEYFQPQWSPDGEYVYFTHVNYQSGQSPEILRMRYPNGNLEKVAADAYWPRLSQDGTTLVYVNFQSDSRVNRLFTARPDGTEAKPVRVTAISPPVVIDAPMFSPDNQTILFSAPVLSQYPRGGWAERLFGITVAKADGTIPSDWWSVGSAGGRPKPLTNIQSLALYGWYSPDNQHVASFSVDGIFVMKPDGTGVTLVVSQIGASSGTVDWIP